MPNLHVVTMATKSGGYLPQLLQSCKRYHIEPTILGEGAVWNCHMMKLRLLYDHLRSREFIGDDIILWLDAYDTIIQNDKRAIWRAFRHYRKPLLFSSERGVGWPMPAKMFPEGPWEYRGICAGVWIGEVWAIRQMLDFFDPHNMPDVYPGDDQGLIQAFAFLKPSLCAIDVQSRLCETLSLQRDNPIGFDEITQKFINYQIGETPCILHGAARYNMNYELSRLGYEIAIPV